MDPVLVKLLRLRLRGAVRRSFRGLKTGRGIVFFVLGVGTIMLCVGPQVLLLFLKREPVDPNTLRDVVPVGLLVMSLMALLGGTRQEGICFTPAEVDILFPGPFTRRHLLLFKLAGGLGGTLFASVFTSIMMMRYVNSWIATFVGLFLAVVFVQLLTTLLVLFCQTMAQQAYTVARKVVLFSILGLLGAIAVRWAPTMMSGGFVEAAHGLRESEVGRWLLLLFEPFVRTIAAERVIPDLVGWAAAAAAIDLVLLALVVRIDVNYLESSVVASQKRYQFLQRRRQGRMFAKPKTSLRMPPLPWLGGIGPIAWRQMTTALRSLHGLIPFLLVILGFAAVPLFFQAMKTPAAIPALVGQMVFVTIVMTRAAAFDFRGDLDGMDWLKSLPLRPTAIAVGQLVAPVSLLTCVHFLFLAVAMVLMPTARPVLFAVAGFSPLFNFLLLGLDNLLFLLFPVRIVASTPGDLQHMGRSMLDMFVKMIVLAGISGVAAAISWVGYLLADQSWFVAIGLAWLALLVFDCAIVPCVAWAYNRYDVSVDTPT
jgi:hypothetical protein